MPSDEEIPRYSRHRLVIHVPTEKQLTQAREKFDADLGGVDDVLCRAFQDASNASSRRGVMTKVILIDRVYKARLEIRAKPQKGERALDLIGDFLTRHWERVEAIVAGVDEAGAGLTAAALMRVLRQHGELHDLLASELTHGVSTRSFVSKYLHFHRPVTPIYDELCRKALWDRVEGAFRLDPVAGIDDQYHEFCVRFFELYGACHRAELPVTVKDLDALLWQLPSKPLPPTGLSQPRGG